MKEVQKQADKYHAANKKILVEDAKNKYRSWTEKQKIVKREYEGESYHTIVI